MKQERPYVMVVDDDEVDAFVLRKAFGGLGVDLEHLLSGDELMACLEASPPAEKPPRRPNLILLDINMPAMDGFQVLQTLRATPATHNIPVVMFTTSSLENDIEKAYREGANSYFVKPGSMEDLTRFVQTLDEYWFHLAKLPPTWP